MKDENIEKNNEIGNQIPNLGSQNTTVEQVNNPVNQTPIFTQHVNNQNQVPNMGVKVEEKVQTNQTIQQPVKKVNDEIIIGKLEKEKESSPIAVLILFILLAAAAFGMPFISEKYTEYKNSKIPIKDYTPDSQLSGSGDSNEGNEQQIVELNSNTSIKFGYFTLNNFTLTNEGEDSYVNFTLSRDSDSFAYNTNLYLELFSESNTLLVRTKINPGNATENTINLKSIITKDAVANAKKIQLAIKDQKEFPSITLDKDLLNKQYLVCSRKTMEYTYTFTEYRLTEITEKETVIKGTNEQAYLDALKKSQSFKLFLTNLEGVQSEVITSDTGYTMLNQYSLSKFDSSKLDGIQYFKASTEARVVNFELEASGYTCE